MHRSEADQMVARADCGTEIRLRLERGFALDGETVLWAECSLRRGGSYDDAQDRWTTPPRVDDLKREF